MIFAKWMAAFIVVFVLVFSIGWAFLTWGNPFVDAEDTVPEGKGICQMNIDGDFIVNITSMRPATSPKGVYVVILNDTKEEVHRTPLVDIYQSNVLFTDAAGGLLTPISWVDHDRNGLIDKDDEFFILGSNSTLVDEFELEGIFGVDIGTEGSFLRLLYTKADKVIMEVELVDSGTRLNRSTIYGEWWRTQFVSPGEILLDAGPSFSRLGALSGQSTEVRVGLTCGNASLTEINVSLYGFESRPEREPFPPKEEMLLNRTIVPILYENDTFDIRFHITFQDEWYGYIRVEITSPDFVGELIGERLLRTIHFKWN